MSLVKRLLGVPENRSIMYGLFGIPRDLDEFVDLAKNSGEPVKITMGGFQGIRPYNELDDDLFSPPNVAIVLSVGRISFNYSILPFEVGYENIENVTREAKENLRLKGLNAEVFY